MDLVRESVPDPFDALIAQGVTAHAPDPSAEPTLVEPLAANPEPGPTREPEPEVALRVPWWRMQAAWACAGSLALAVAVAVAALSSSLSPPHDVELPPLPPPRAAVRAPAAVEVAPAAPPVVKAKRAARPVKSSAAGFVEWPGERRKASAPAPKQKNELKRPAL